MQKLMTILGLGFVALTSLQAQAAEIDACTIKTYSPSPSTNQVLFKIEGDTMGSLEDKTITVETKSGPMTLRFAMLGSFVGEKDVTLDTTQPRRIGIVVKGPEKTAKGELDLKSITSMGMPSGGSMTLFAGGNSVYVECINFKSN